MYLLDAEPDWRNAVRAGFELLSVTESGLTNRETRRPLAEALRTVLQFSITVTGTGATRLAAGLRAWTTEPVAVPFWPGAVRWADRDTAPFVAKLWLAVSADGSTSELFEESGKPEWITDECLLVPVLLGRIARNDPTWLSPVACQFQVEFEEASAPEYALQVVARDWTAGPAPSSAWSDDPPKLLPLAIHFDQPSLGASVEIVRERLGFGRQPVETAYPQAPMRRGEAPMVESDADAVAGLVRFFVDHGAGAAFWVPAWSAAATLAAGTTGPATELAVEAGHDVQGGDWLIVQSATGSSISRVAAVMATAITLVDPVGTHDPSAQVSHLLLCRFERPRLQLDWLTPSVARGRLAIRELTSEYTPASDETLGVTLGRLPVQAWLYEIEEPTRDGLVVHRFTSFERDLDVEGDLYRAANIDHGALRQGIALDRDEVELRLEVPADAAHPLVRLATLRSEVPLQLRIRRLQFAHAA